MKDSLADAAFGGLRVMFFVVLVLAALFGVKVTAPASAAGATAVSAGAFHTCALTDTASVKCWGYNADGELGDGTNIYRNTPGDVCATGATPPCTAANGNVLVGVTAIVAGTYHSCVLMSAGGAKCWGKNSSGQLGDETTGYPSCECRPTPVDVIGLTSGVKALAVGRYHTCALTQAGGLKCWGFNSSGQLGDGTTLSRATPGDVLGVTSGVSAVAAGALHTCVLTTSGGVQCWGDNGTGQLGDGTTTHQRLTTADVSGLTSGVAAIAAGGLHTCAVIATGSVKCWGLNSYGQLGDGTRELKASPVNVCAQTFPVCTPLSDVTTVTAGGDHTCALTTSGGVKCWGVNGHGELGDGTSEAPRTPVVDVVGITSGVSAISAGADAEHTCALTTANSVKCWGDNLFGQLGTATGDCSTGRGHPCSNTPVDVEGIKPTATPTDTAMPTDTATPNDMATPTDTPTQTRTPTPLAHVGDANCNGVVDPVDALLILQFYASLIDSLGCPGKADANLDGSTDAVDALLILQFYAGLIHNLIADS